MGATAETRAAPYQTQTRPLWPGCTRHLRTRCTISKYVTTTKPRALTELAGYNVKRALVARDALMRLRAAGWQSYELRIPLIRPHVK